MEPQLEYKKLVAKGKLDILLGGSYSGGVTNAQQHLTGSDYINDALITSVSNATNVYASNGTAQYKYIGIFGRINYNLDDKYIININARRDGSTKFGPGRQF